MIQDLSGSWCIIGTGESITRVDSPVPLMHHDPDRSWITDPDPDHPKGTHPKKFKAQPTNAFFATVNQMFGGSSQLPTAAERAVLEIHFRQRDSARQ